MSPPDMPPTESKLYNLVERATNDLTPSPQYSLTISDIPISNLAPKDFGFLELTFDQILERKGHAKAVLALDVATGSLYPAHLYLPIKDSSNQAWLTHTEKLGYIPTFISPVNAEAEMTLKRPQLSKDKLMEMLSINQPRSLDAGAYRLWLSNLLTRSNAWRLNEQLEVPLSINEEQITSLIFRHYSEVRRNKIGTLRSVSRRTSRPKTDTTHTVVANTIEVGDTDSYKSSVHVRREAGVQTPNDVYDPGIIWTERSSIPINPATTPPLLLIAREALRVRESQLD